MSDWIPVILLKQAGSELPQAGEEASNKHVEVINALMHRRHLERTSGWKFLLSQVFNDPADSASDGGGQAQGMLLSLFRALLAETQGDVEGGCWILTLSRRKNIDCGPKAQMALLPIPVRFGPYCYQNKPPQVEAGGKTSALTPSEARLLEVLLLRVGQVVDRAELLSAVAPLQSDERTVDRAVCRLRRKLSAVDELHANILRTARMRGYIIHVGRGQTRTMR
jgi:DNA-binding winged helix-turn-helix (wHTH) protein